MLPVILFHAGISGFAGGFVGVDIFFVISGYLITLIIHIEIREHRFSIVNFYERRARRILPALFAVCVVSIACAWPWMLPEGMDRFGESVSAVTVFSSNLLFWHHAGYFDAASEVKPLIHTWTLAVEEQFYVFFPLILIALRRLSSQRLLWVLIALWLVSIGLSEYTAYHFQTTDFFLLPTRAWELGTGAIIAVGIPGAGRLGRRATAEIGSVAGIALIIYAIAAYDSTVPFPSLWALAPVIGSALIIVFARRETIVGTILCSRPFVGIGLISYSAYLWHQPIFAYLRIRSLNQVPDTTLLAASAASILIAYVSWRHIERPFRDKRQTSRRTIFAAGAAGSAALFAFGVGAHVTDGFPSRLAPKALSILNYTQHQKDIRYKCEASSSDFIRPEDACTRGADTDPTIAIWGDSHAAAVSKPLADDLETHGVSFKELSSSGCMPTTGYRIVGAETRCTRYTPLAYKYLISHNNIKTVILIARYAIPFTGESFNNGRGGVDHDGGHYAVPTDAEYSNDRERADALGKQIMRTTQTLLDHGKHVVIVYPIPEAGWYVPDHMAKLIRYGAAGGDDLWTPIDAYRKRNKGVFRQLDRLPHNDDVIRVYPAKAFCDDDGRCSLASEGKPLYTDQSHVNEIGGHLVTSQIVSKMAATGWIPN